MSWCGPLHLDGDSVLPSQDLESYQLLYLLIRRGRWHPTPALLPGESHGRRILVGCSPWGRWGSDGTERFHFHPARFSLLFFLDPYNAHVDISRCCLRGPTFYLSILFSSCYWAWVIFTSLSSRSLFSCITSANVASLVCVCVCVCVCVLISVTVFSSCLVLYYILLLSEVLTLSIYSSPDLDEHLYNHYLEHFFFFFW